MKIPFLSIFASWFSFAILASLHATPLLLEEWRWETARPQGNHLYALGTNGVQLVAVGEGGTILTSVDGFDWRVRRAPGRETLRAVASANGKIVAVGDRGAILTSPDGSEWTETESGTFADLHAITYGAGRFVAVGDGSTILTSEDGIGWSAVDIGSSNRAFRLISYGNGRFVAAEEFALHVSTDGVNWVEQAIPSTALLTYGAGYFYKIRGDSHSLRRSSDGVTWEWISFGPISTAIDIDPSAGRLIGAAGGGEVYEHLLNYSSLWRPIRQANGATLHAVMTTGNRIVAVGEHGVILNWRAPHGVNPSLPPPLHPTLDYGVWTESHAPWMGQLYGFEEYDDRLIAVGAGGAIVTSADGGHWVELPSGASHDLRGIARRDDLLIAVGDLGTVLESTTGEEWVTLPPITNADLTDIVAAASGNDVVAVGGGGAILFRAADGDWSLTSSGVSSDLHGVAWGDGRFVAVGEGGTILTRAGSEQWIQADAGTSARLSDVAYGQGMFVAVGASGVILRSQDGIVWEAQSSPVTETLRVVHQVGGAWVTAGDEGVLLASSNGTDWEVRESGTVRSLVGAGNGFGRMFVSGKDVVLSSGFIELDPPSATVSSAAQSYSLTIRAPGPWTAVGTAGAVPSSGEGDAEISVSVPEHTGLQDRELFLSINGAMHTILQEGRGYRVNATVSGFGEVALDPDPEGGRLPAGTTVRLTATPAERFGGWSGDLAGTDPVLEVVLQEDLSVTANFLSNASLQSVAVLDDRIFAAGRGGALLSIEADGHSIVAIHGGDRRVWNSLATGNGKAVAVARDGSLAVSSGEEWWVSWINLGRGLWGIHFYDGTFRVIGDHGTLYESGNAIEWEAVPTGTMVDLRGIAFGNGMGVIVGDEGTVLRSLSGGE